jgi:DNA-binding HxlR family transcriptional regulator
VNALQDQAERSDPTATPGVGSRGDGSPACSIEQALQLVGDRWSMLILRDAFRGIRRFDEIRRDLGTPRAVLAERLRKLVDAGILQRQRYQEHPPRDEYRLTDMGRELSPILVALMHWGDRWLQDAGPPTVLVHEPCGSDVHLGFHCPACGVDFGPLEIASRPGPGARP